MCHAIEYHAGVSALMEGITVYIRHDGRSMLTDYHTIKNVKKGLSKETREDMIRTMNESW
jgi:hypothetical protein